MHFMKFAAAGFGCLIFLAASPVEADFTPIGAPPSGEPTTDTILDTLYGAGSFSGVDWTNGTVSATRIDDYAAGGDPIAPGGDHNLVSGGGVDQIWTDGVASFEGRVRFASFSQRFGIDFDASDRTAGPDGSISGALDSELLNVVGSGYDSALSGTVAASFNFVPGDRWAWYRDGTTTNFSAAALNPDASSGFVGSDHMITYEITGLTDPQFAGQSVWLLLWDDQTSPSTDRDFNDLAVQLSASVVPVPGAVILGVLGLGIVGFGKRWLC